MVNGRGAVLVTITASDGEHHAFVVPDDIALELVVRSLVAIQETHRLEAPTPPEGK
jgi:hypothetical protein